MQIKAIRDAKGRLVGTVEQPINDAAIVQPEPAAGLKIEHIELPRNYSFDLDSVFKKLAKKK